MKRNCEMKLLWMFSDLHVPLFRGILCMLLGLIIAFPSVYGQAQEKLISLDVKDISVLEAIKTINQLGGNCISYKREELEKERKRVTLKLNNVQVIMAVDSVLKGTSLNKVLYQNVILIVPEKVKNDKETITLKGVVTDEDGNPLPGVAVILKGTTLGSATDKDGHYSLSLMKTSEITLVFTFIGMESQEISYTGENTINVIMKEGQTELEEVTVVSTGYQTIDRRKLTSAVTSIKAADIVVPGLTSIDQMLEGHVPGMIFMQNSGQLGATPRLRIRGTSTIIGNQEPIWVVDGIVQTDPVNVDPSQINDLDFVNLLGNAISGINPEDIEQIDVLKDASATAIYGARAANGVIVITTKKGKIGPPSISYSVSGTYMRRPRYTDRSVNMMNSKERVAFSRELIEKRVQYPEIKSWVGYEAVMKDFYNDKINFAEMQQQVSYLERLNTDWFNLLTNDAFSHNHTLSISGGSPSLRYYASIGFNNSDGNIKGEMNKLYSSNVKLNVTFDRFTLQFGMSGNVANKKYVPGDVNVMDYAYNTNRAIPARNPDGSLWFYSRPGGDGSRLFNIMNEMENSSQRIQTNTINLNTTINYQIIDPLKVGLTLSYGTSNTTQEEFHGADTYYVRCLQSTNDDNNALPFGGELKEGRTWMDNYMIRAQIDYNQFMDIQKNHLITAVVGGEISSKHYKGLQQSYRGYLPERGQQMAEIDFEKYPAYAKWLQTNEAKGVRSDRLTNLISGYITISYSYKDLYMLNANARLDASNNFGSKSNEKLLPIWSFSGRWNVKEDILENVNWINELSLRASFGLQGNMLETESSQLVIQKGTYNSTLDTYKSSIYRYPNPELRWEKTTSTNLTLEFSLWKNKIRGNVSYFYKKTKDAFLSKTISTVNGRNTYTVNSGNLENKGIEVALNFIPLNYSTPSNPEGFRWSFDPQLGQIINQLVNNSRKDKSVRDVVTFDDYLSGNVDISGRPLNTFYSYKFDKLDSVDGRPMFKDVEEERRSEYEQMEKEAVFTTVMTHSGTRVPKIQGGFSNTFSYKRFTLAFNLTYSLGAKVRLLKLYPNIAARYGTIAPQPEENVRKEFLSRWRNPGDELTTNIPGIISDDEFQNTLSSSWWIDESYAFADNIWQMYDNSDLRVVSGDYLKMQSLSFRYNVPNSFCKKLYLKSAYIGFSCTNVFTLCNKNLKGQDPATQSGSAPSINMSLRPTYSLNLNVSF